MFNNTNYNTTIGKIIKTLRQERGLSQQQVANKLGITAPAFSKIESGFTDINFSRLVQIAQVFSISLIELICYGKPIEGSVDLEEVSRLKLELARNKAEIIELQKKLIKQLERDHI